jgi:hypothetical protein
MSEHLNPSEFRKDVYGIIKQVSATGDPVQIETRQGDVLQLARVRQGSRFAQIVPMPDLMRVDAEELVSTDWSRDWDADSALAP